MFLLQIGGEETSVTFEDQQQINTFARKNAKLQELKDEILEKKVMRNAFLLLKSQVHFVDLFK